MSFSCIGRDSFSSSPSDLWRSPLEIRRRSHLLRFIIIIIYLHSTIPFILFFSTLHAYTAYCRCYVDDVTWLVAVDDGKTLKKRRKTIYTLRDFVFYFFLFRDRICTYIFFSYGFSPVVVINILLLLYESSSVFVYMYIYIYTLFSGLKCKIH